MIDRTLCPGCGSEKSTMLADIPFSDPHMEAFFQKHYEGRIERPYLEGGSYVLNRCDACGLLWQRTVLTDEGMERLYGHWIHSGQSSAKRKSGALRLQYARHCARLLELFPSPGDTRLLDFGMGWGEWCEMAQAFGFQVHGTELSEERIAHAQSRGISAGLPDALPESQFDFIYLEQVLEHLPRPQETLQKLIGHLKPGGYIHIGVPDASDVERHVSDRARLLSKGPSQPLEHINMYTPQALKQALHALGCEPAKQRESLVRVRPFGTFLKDVALAVLRHLPASRFPPGTSLLFRKIKTA